MLCNCVDNNDKFAARSDKCVFIGYSSIKKGYKLYNIETKTVLFSRDVKFYETVFPFKKDFVFDVEGINVLNFFDQAVNKSDEPNDDKRDNSVGDSDGITKSLDYADVSTDTFPIVTSQSEEVVTKSPVRPSNNSPYDLGSSGASLNGDDATLNDDEYESEGEDFVDFSHFFESDRSNIPERFVLKRSSREYKMPSKFDNYELDKRVKYDINLVVSYTNLSMDNFVFSTNVTSENFRI
ncbi:ribonuclease H-like domain-containing protein [Tanacetum coccineum]